MVTRTLSMVIAWACMALLAITPLAAMFLLFNLKSFASLAQASIGLPIQWWTVSSSQWYLLWALTAIYLSIGLAGLFFLRRAFFNFARGELFSRSNSQDVRRFAALILIQALATPVHFSIASVLLSLNHPAGQKILSVSVGSNELKAIGIGLILWVVSDLLVEGGKLHAENQQFV